MPQWITYIPYTIYENPMDEAVHNVSGKSGRENLSGVCNINKHNLQSCIEESDTLLADKRRDSSVGIRDALRD
jgi:hypothetical protein